MRETFGVLPNGPNRFRYFRKGDLFGYRKSTWGKYWIFLSFFFFFTRNFTLEDHSRFRLKSFFQSFLKDFFKSFLLFV